MAIKPRVAPAPAQNLVSFKLETFTGGVGLQEGDYILKSHKIHLFDYDGKGPTTLAMEVTAQEVKIAGNKFEATGPDLIQNYSIGDATQFGPSDSGTAIVAIGTKTSLGKGSKFFTYLENMINAGFDEGSYDNDVSVFDGCVVHIVELPDKERNLPQSNVNPNNTQPRNTPRTTSVVSWIYAGPGEPTVTNPRPGVGGAAPARTTANVGKDKVNGAPAAAAAAAAAPEGDQDAETVLAEALTKHIGSAQSVPRLQTRISIFKSLAGLDAASKDAVMGVFNDDASLGNVLGAMGYKIEGSNIVRN